MQKWEYAILDCELVNYWWRPKRFKGEEIPGWKNLNWAPFLDKVGNEGWELVGFSHSGDNEVWVFKRPKG